MSLLLGSQSIGRRLVLEKAGIDFSWLATSSPEKSASGTITLDDVIKLVIENSRLKMDSLLMSKDSKNYNILLTADTVVWSNNKIYGKAPSVDIAKKYLNELSGKIHSCITAVTIILIEKNTIMHRKVIHDITEVKLTDKNILITNYLDSDEWKGKAGAYAIQGLGSILIEKINGDYNNIIGLPLHKILDYLFSVENFSSLHLKKDKN